MYRDNYGLADYHVHPDFSFDARGTVDEYCQAALKKGLVEICFTSHFDTNPMLRDEEKMIRIDGELMPFTVGKLRHYAEMVRQAHEKYFPRGLAVKCGLEAGYYPGCESLLKEYFEAIEFDYRLGAIHEVGQIELCYEKSMDKYCPEMSVEELVGKYFELVAAACRSGYFDAIAHFDLYKRFGRKYYGDKTATVHRELIGPVFEAMVESETGLELNTSALRKGMDEYYPSMDIVNMARSAGVRIVAMGSDAHRPEEVGYDLEGAATIAHELFPYCDE